MKTKLLKLVNLKTISIFILVVFCLDRIFKYLALAGKIFFYKNTGIAFGISFSSFAKASADKLLVFVILIILIILIHLLIKEIKNKNLLPITYYLLLITGTASNLIDRIKFGFVIDYLNFYFFYNNLADVMIVLGIALLAWKLLIKNDC